MKPGTKIITVSAVELNHKSNYQDFYRYVEADVAITGDPEATLPLLVEAGADISEPSAAASATSPSSASSSTAAAGFLRLSFSDRPRKPLALLLLVPPTLWLAW